MKKFLYFLIEENGLVRQVVNGIVQSLNKKTPIQAPNGWQDLLISWERDIVEKQGTLRNYSLPMQFYKDAYKITKNDAYKFNADRKLFLLIKRITTEVDNDFFKTYYKQFYKGELDFSTFQDYQTNKYSEMNIMEGKLTKVLKAKEDLEVEIPFDSEAIEIEMDGINLSTKQTWLIPNDLLAGNDLVGLYRTVKEGNASGVAFFDVQNQNTPSDLDDSTEFFFYTSQSINGILIEGEYKWNLLIAGTLNVRLKSNKGQNILLGSSTSASGTLVINQAFNAVAEEKFYLIATDSLGHHTLESKISVSLKSKYQSTRIKAFTPAVLHKKILKALTGVDTYYENSDLLNVCTFALTSGDAIRGITDAKLKISYKRFCEGYRKLLMGGSGVENNKSVINEKRYFLNEGITPVDLGEVSSVKVDLANELLFSSIKVGFQTPETDNVNGKDEFNCEQVWDAPFTRGNKTLDLIVPFKAGALEIESKRILYDGKETTDDKSDNDLFLIDFDSGNEIEPNVFGLNRDVVIASGVSDVDSMFNVRLSPKRILLTNGSWIRSCLYGYDSEYLKFQKSERNSDLVAGGITENENILINDLAAPIAKPFIFTITPVGTFDYSEILEGEINQTFSFPLNGNTYKGFSVRIAVAPNTEDSQEIKLLSFPSNDLKKLI